MSQQRYSHNKLHKLVIFPKLSLLTPMKAEIEKCPNRETTKINVNDLLIIEMNYFSLVHSSIRKFK